MHEGKKSIAQSLSGQTGADREDIQSPRREIARGYGEREGETAEGQKEEEGEAKIWVGSERVEVDEYRFEKLLVVSELR